MHKRDASHAQLDDSHSQRIKHKTHQFSLQIENAALERRVLSLESEKTELQTRLTQKERQVAKLESDRRWLADREKEQRDENEQERRDREQDNAQTAATIRTLRTDLSTLRDQHADLQESHSTLSRTSTNTINSQSSQILDLTRKSTLLQDELHSAKQLADAHELNARTLRAELDAVPTRAGDDGAGAGGEEWRIVRDELHRQTTYMHSLESTNAKLTAELASLRARHESVQVLQEQLRTLQRRADTADSLRESLARLQAAQEQEHEHEPQSSAPAPPVPETQALSALRTSHALLQEQHGQITLALQQRTDALERAESRLGEATARVDELERDVEEMKSGARRRERRVDLAEREVAFLKALVESFREERGGGGAETETETERMEHLEQTITALKADNAALEEEICVVAEGKRRGAKGWSDLLRAVEDEKALRAKAEQELTQTTHTLTQTSQTLTQTLSSLSTLSQQLYDLQGDVASGAHVPPGVRVLAMRENPASVWEEGREDVVRRLRRENGVLLERVGVLERERGGGGGDGGKEAQGGGDRKGGMVPRESWENERKERELLEETLKQKEKRLLRLQQVYTTKALEFRTAMSAILGFKLRFLASGRVRVTSMFDVNTSFVFQPVRGGGAGGSGSGSGSEKKEGEGKEGKKGKESGNADADGEGETETETTMQLIQTSESAALPDLGRTVEYWVKERMCIPGLMASVVLECYERTRRGGGQMWGGGGV